MIMNKKEINKITKSLLDYLKNNLNKGRYTPRTFYGELFTALAMANFDKLYFKNDINEILNYFFKDLDKNYSEFHWEFNNYALIELSKLVDLSMYINQYIPLKFKGTKSSNWVMLRALTRIKANEKPFFGHFEFMKTLILFQSKNGLIKDSIYDKSFQYHCFMSYILLEAYKESGQKYYLNRFLKALQFIEKFILSNGDFNYIGRGQKQIFGIGPLLYILEEGYIITGDLKYKNKQRLVFQMLIKFQRDDGSFPLVLRKEEQGYPEVIDVNNDSYLGWYRYNNYFDYLPFLAYFLTEWLRVFTDVGECEIEVINKTEVKYFSKDFLIHRGKSFEFVLSKPERKLSNNLPIPYIVMNSVALTSNYGGEDMGSGLYNYESIPLPWGKINHERTNISRYEYLPSIWLIREYNIKSITKSIINYVKGLNNYYFLDFLIYNLVKYEIIGSNRRFTHRRSFKVENRNILVKDTIRFKKKTSFIEFHIIHLLFKELKRIDDRTFQSGIGLAIKFSNNQFLPRIRKGCYFCSDYVLDSLEYIERNITYNKNDEIVIEYILEPLI